MYKFFQVPSTCSASGPSCSDLIGEALECHLHIVFGDRKGDIDGRLTGHHLVSRTKGSSLVTQVPP